VNRTSLEPGRASGYESGVRRRGHLRLIGFFGLLALGASVAGTALLAALDAPPAAGAVLIACVFAVATLGFLGVFVHRLTIAKVRWRETQAYLQRIERASDRYRALMEGAADLLLVVDPAAGSVREGNLAAREGLACGSELPAPLPTEPLGSRASAVPAAPGVALERVVAEADLARVRAALAEVVAGAPRSLGDVQLLGRGGAAPVADARLAVLELGGQRAVLLALRDRSRERDMERQLAVHERLSSLGLLTAGVAHEINNPLEGIANYLSLLERPDLAASDRARYLELVRHGFARVGEIVRDLLSFARPRSGSDAVDLGAVVERAVKLVALTADYKAITIERSGFERPCTLVGDAGRLEQLIFNLLLNAGQAIGGAGGIGRVGVHARALGSGRERQLELAVEDTGPGIAPEHLDRLFDPFFTTRSGTGLGLAVSYGIARAHGGALSAENRAQGGARFVLRLDWPENGA